MARRDIPAVFAAVGVALVLALTPGAAPHATPPAVGFGLSATGAAPAPPALKAPPPPATTEAPAPPTVIEAIDGPLGSAVGLEDRGFALVGGDYERARLGMPAFDDNVTVAIVGAPWCQPCVAELDEVVALGERLASGPVNVVFASVDGSGGPAGLALAVDDLFARYNARHAVDRSLTPPGWMAFRADPGWAWAALASPALGLASGETPEIPLTLVIDRCGAVRLVARGALDRDAARRVEQAVEALILAPATCDSARSKARHP